MGLDMYFFRQGRDEIRPGEPGFTDSARSRIQYFRKHSDLHGFLADIWEEEHPGEEFNYEYLRITPEILGKMKELVAMKDKPHHSGFFWGESSDGDWEETREMLPRIAEILALGDRVYYYAWW